LLLLSDLLQKVSQFQKPSHIKEGSPPRELKKWIGRQEVRPFRWKKPQPPFIIVKVDAVRAQSAPKRDHRELTAKQRMERVSHPKNLYVAVAIRCN
jgi:hypothetical protein